MNDQPNQPKREPWEEIAHSAAQTTKVGIYSCLDELDAIRDNHEQVILRAIKSATTKLQYEQLRAELAALRAENERLKSGASEPSHAAEGTPLATSKGGIESTPDSNPNPEGEK